ncbi:hypothetical protein NB533_00005 [Vibrio parahaemolyticus]|nr:hypothetical protein [Vibrio parahaemolyticus]MCR9854822.1 hypothetical protein [Vibrio parahaemolyticus]MDG2608906.1 hypothetical protein [Vibrio parahaemolyticus]
MTVTKFFDYEKEEKRVLEELKKEIESIQAKQKNEEPKPKNTT